MDRRVKLTPVELPLSETFNALVTFTKTVVRQVFFCLYITLIHVQDTAEEWKHSSSCRCYHVRLRDNSLISRVWLLQPYTSAVMNDEQESASGILLQTS